MDIRTVALNKLHFGHEADPPINVRQVGRDEDIEQLAATIAATRLGQALNVKEIDGKIYVADGNRRLAALRLNVSKGLLAEDWPTPCDFDPVDDELSLALNIERVAMHPADEYVKFHEMHAGGRSPEDIANRFGLEPIRVRRRLALGALAPMIIDAWRNGKLGDRADETVRTFTMTSKIEEQERVFKKLAKSGQLWPQQVRQELGFGGSHETAGMLAEIGVDVYKKAGGSIVEDLFSENHHPQEPALVKKLWDAKVTDTIARLTAEGWAWVEMAADLPYSWSYSWQKIETPTDADKKRAGCVVEITYSKGIRVIHAVKPKPSKVEKPKDAPAKPAMISNAVAQRLSVAMARGVKGAMKANPHTALAAVLAGLGSSGYGLPMMIKADGNVRVGRQHEPFEQLLARYLAMPIDDLLAALAIEAGEMVHFHTNYADKPILDSKVHSDLAEAMEPEALQEALRAAFDAEDYFKSVPRSFTEASIGVACGDDKARNAGKLRKGDLVAYAVANVPKTGWLPEELRTSTYAGPGAVKAKPVKVSRKKAA